MSNDGIGPPRILTVPGKFQVPSFLVPQRRFSLNLKDITAGTIARAFAKEGFRQSIRRQVFHAEKTRIHDGQAPPLTLSSTATIPIERGGSIVDIPA
jgi:hypothetical protein